MKKFLFIAICLSLGLGLARAGDDKEVVVIEPQDPVGFTKTEISPFAAGMFLDGGAGDELGGGIMLSHFFTENIGIDLSYSAFAFDSEIHTVTADLALHPMAGAALSPYFVFGGGLRTNGSTDGIYRVGGGLDFHPNGVNSVGIFADGVYNFVEGDDGFTIARFGIRFPF